MTCLLLLGSDEPSLSLFSPLRNVTLLCRVEVCVPIAGTFRLYLAGSSGGGGGCRISGSLSKFGNCPMRCCCRIVFVVVVVPFPCSCANSSNCSGSNSFVSLNRQPFSLLDSFTCLLLTSRRPLGQTLRQLFGSAFDHIRPQPGTGVSFNQAQLTAANQSLPALPPEPQPERKPETVSSLSASEPTKETTSVSSESSSSSEPEQPKRQITPDSASMAEAEQQPAAPAAENAEEEEEKEYVPTLPARRSYKYDDPPIIFRDVDVRREI